VPVRARSRALVHPFAEKIDELVDRSRARVRADVVHGVLVAMGYEGSYRTTRWAVAEGRSHGHQRGEVTATHRAELCGRRWGETDGH
jgi:hypothetical protein